MSPRTLPSPMYPRPYDGSMWSQERAMVDSLNQRSRHPSLANPMSVMPIDEHSPLAARPGKAAILPPINAERRLPSPASPGLTPPRELVAQIPEQYRPAANRQPGTSPLLGRQTVRAVVRPRALERQPFLIQRTFDMGELRATIPDLPARSEGAVASSPTIGSGSSPGQVRASAPQHHPQPMSSPRRRSSSIKSGALLSTPSGPLDPEGLMRDAKAVPIHLKYARAHLPVLAALLASGHVRDGDVVYLPLPHPEAWPQTARYVYTGQGEPTLAERENIAYLAGKA
ncbi:hypothetical protein DL768_000696 [Monosporascus sp. mg162]|nr:hypothetical protein DL768_000696 [Monosporascus sp. mg162]